MRYVLALLALALLGCAGPQYTHWESRNFPSPITREQSAQFDRDKYECWRENTYSSAYANRYYGTSGTEVNEELALACMNARGWYLAKRK